MQTIYRWVARIKYKRRDSFLQGGPGMHPFPAPPQPQPRNISLEAGIGVLRYIWDKIFGSDVQALA